jgi:hypothetical protein
VSVVYHDGVLVPHDKVKKNISRHVHPNDVYRPGKSSLIGISPTYTIRRSSAESKKRRRSLTISDLWLPSTLTVPIYTHEKIFRNFGARTFESEEATTDEFGWRETTNYTINGSFRT